MRVRLRAAALALLLPAAALPWIAGAQQDPAREITESQRRLQEIRAERTALRRELSRIRTRVGDVSAEIRNIQRQQTVSNALLREISLQITATEQQMSATTLEMVATQSELRAKRQLLNRRLRDIYKRGPVHTAQVLLSAESFSDLINRYRYLYLVARRDRGLVSEVAELAQELVLREQELRRSLADMQFLQNEREQENATLASLRSQRGQTLTTLRGDERETNLRLEAIARDERRLTGLITELERRRTAAAAAPAAPGGARPSAPTASSMTTADIGNLDWPVSGRIAYSYGRATQPNGTVIRYNGIGIAAAAGSPVRAVEAGTVEMAAPFESYGPTVVVSHGGGYYSLYLYLRDIQVRTGATITRGQVIGTVGGESTPEGSHVEFQIRQPGGSAVDPLAWLRSRR